MLVLSSFFSVISLHCFWPIIQGNKLTWYIHHTHRMEFSKRWMKLLGLYEGICFCWTYKSFYNHMWFIEYYLTRRMHKLDRSLYKKKYINLINAAIWKEIKKNTIYFLMYIYRSKYIVIRLPCILGFISVCFMYCHLSKFDLYTSTSNPWHQGYYWIIMIVELYSHFDISSPMVII